jgi:GntR family transcriptional regulator, transcriptional repressor for pyruvate dehydrogenase complex
MYKKIEYKSSYEYAVSYIEKLIVAGKLKPGDKLPPENILAEKMGISRLTLREGMRELEGAGLIYTIRGGKGGRFVTKANSKILTNAFDIIMRINKTSFEELQEARKILEGATVKLAAERITKEKLVEIEKNVSISPCKLTNRNLFIKNNYQFHELIANASGNTVLVTTLQSLKNIFDRPFINMSNLSESGVSTALEQHKNIFKALIDKNAFMAEKLMIEHIEELEKRL